MITIRFCNIKGTNFLTSIKAVASHLGCLLRFTSRAWRAFGLLYFACLPCRLIYSTLLALFGRTCLLRWAMICVFWPAWVYRYLTCLGLSLQGLVLLGWRAHSHANDYEQFWYQNRLSLGYFGSWAWTSDNGPIVLFWNWTLKFPPSPHNPYHHF